MPLGEMASDVHYDKGIDGYHTKDSAGRRMVPAFVKPEMIIQRSTEKENLIDKLGEGRNWSMRNNYKLKDKLWR